MTSHTYVVPTSASGLLDKVKLLKEHAAAGHCYLKGTLLKELEKESRASQTDNEAATHNVVFDIDGILLDRFELPEQLDDTDIRQIAERVVQFLPPTFRDVSYIVHASGSMGMKGNKISLHMDFMLDEPIYPQQLKRYLQRLNFAIPEFQSQLDLTATGTALRYKLDVSLADNSRLIFIGNPIFTEIANPIPDPDHRIFLVEKVSAAAHLSDKERGITQAAITKDVQKHLLAIRENRGLGKLTAKTSAIKRDGAIHHVVINPDGCQMDFSYEKQKYIYYNINGGDSNAYYVHRDDPTIVWNFKGEQPFLFEQADPETYQAHVDKFVAGREELEGVLPPTPIGFRDRLTNQCYQGLVDRVNNRLVNVDATDRQGIADWLTQYDSPVPENVPVWDYIFDPTDPRVVDIPNKFINKHSPSLLLQTPKEIPDELIGLQRGEAVRIKEICPNIWNLLESVCGNGEAELEHFVNWLAFIVNEKNKSGTAWVMHGIQGTGKGVLFEYVLKPLFGRHAMQLRPENLDEMFNNWMEESILVMLDEFNFKHSKSREALLAKMKNYITEPEVTIRGMRQNTRTMKSFANFIICSNDHDILRPDETDRRYNICPRQEKRLFDQFPEMSTNIRQRLTAEVPYFASVLSQFNYDEDQVRVALENDAKKSLRAAARTVVEDFVAAIKHGDFDYFVQILEMEDEVEINSPTPAAKAAVRTWLAQYESNYDAINVWTEQLRMVYDALVGRRHGLSSEQFSKMLRRNGFVADSTRRRIGESRKRGYEIVFKITAHDPAELKEEYLINTASGNVKKFSVGA
ncbi:MAG: primase-helicase family protein [Cellvibrionaceae bacterium]